MSDELRDVIDTITAEDDRDRYWSFSQPPKYGDLVDDGGASIVEDPHAVRLLQWLTEVLGTSEIDKWRALRLARLGELKRSRNGGYGSDSCPAPEEHEAYEKRACDSTVEKGWIAFDMGCTENLIRDHTAEKK